eukprot:gnl/MRDRNA2_/MRDRNA2_29226_c0_seq1.p1 gnl/MRDRNA2_/MRDRNA2_29226_c0~~gnl/MRDRNA2_/MRDRNA2_29226_c0_seq1.p1  ORF type:complete len:174 (-),score=20.92 gnl/MRDRNA2_/MRDRNA2_29226_c0_seq1:160-681(-)
MSDGRPATVCSARTSRSARSHRSSRSSASERSDTGSAYKDDPGYQGHAWLATSMQSTLPWASDSVHRQPAKVKEAPQRTKGMMSLICNPSYVGHVRGKHCENVMGAAGMAANRIAAEMIQETDVLGGCRNVPPKMQRVVVTDKHGLPAEKGGLNMHRLYLMTDSPYSGHAPKP